MRRRVRTLRDPEQAWTRIREVRQLRGRAVAVAKEVAAWRERRAAAVDQPTRHVLPDLTVAAISQRVPATEAELRKVRGLEERYLRGGAGASLLEAVQRGADAEVPGARRAGPHRGAPRAAGRAQPADRLGGATGPRPADRRDVAGHPHRPGGAAAGGRGRAPGERAGGAELVGAQIGDLIAGRAALAFDGRGGLVLEERSNRPLGP